MPTQPNPMRELWRDLQDVVGPDKEWPYAIKRALHRKNPSNEDRFKVSVFLLKNGAGPNFLDRWSEIRHFDAPAKRQINYIVNNLPSKNWKAWNVHHKRTM